MGNTKLVTAAVLLQEIVLELCYAQSPDHFWVPLPPSSSFLSWNNNNRNLAAAAAAAVIQMMEFNLSPNPVSAALASSASHRRHASIYH